MSHYLTVDDLTEYKHPVTGPLDTSILITMNMKLPRVFNKHPILTVYSSL